MSKQSSESANKIEITLPPGVSPEAFKKALEKATNGDSDESSGPAFVLFHEWSSGDGQKGRVYRDRYKGRLYFNVRRWYQDKDGYWKPGKGFIFHPEEIDDIIAGLQKCQTWLEEQGPSASVEEPEEGGDELTQQSDV